jgi:membrane protease subunit (stomatin/prohibitin family)
MALIQFTRNYNDHSTDQGFQFEFYCDRCGNGYRTQFQPSATGSISSALDAASSLLGGMFSSAANAVHSVHSAAWERARDAAYVTAVEEAKPHFKKCKRCGKWVDDDCWNPQRGLCKDCAPDLQEEYSSVQVEASVQRAREKAYNEVEVQADFKQTVVGTCPHCGAKLTGGKFCPECGKPVVSKKYCTECGKEVAAGAKFCPECGAKQG